ncbi:hypothetical protein L7F22_036057 [Adiantum nelumboides]|nr:hypothetical protein [Adiantum nelumboides]
MLTHPVAEDVKEISHAHVLFFDGSYRKSHDAASGGIVLYNLQGKLVCKQGFKVDAHSNNEAEYSTLEAGLHICIKHGVRRLCIRGDALLVVKQVLGAWKSKNPTLRDMCFKIKNLLKKFEDWSIPHVERSFNTEAHDATQGMFGELYVLKATLPFYRGRECLELEEEFLLIGVILAVIEKAKKYGFVHRASRYKLIGDVLYIKGVDLGLRRVPWKEELYRVLEENHEGACGGHFTFKITLHKILQDYVWPSIQKGVQRWCTSCKRCQAFEHQGKNWDLELPSALWAYQTSMKTSTGFTPFHLVYGKEALLPVEVEIPAVKMLKKLMGGSDNALKERLLHLQEVQLDQMSALEHYEKMQDRALEKINKKIKEKGIVKGDLVLQYNSKLDKTFQKKFQVKWEGPFMVVNYFANGTYQLANLDGALHASRVNGLHLKIYRARLMMVSKDKEPNEEVMPEEKDTFFYAEGVQMIFAALLC